MGRCTIVKNLWGDGKDLFFYSYLHIFENEIYAFKHKTNI